MEKEKQPSKAKQEWDQFCRKLAQETWDNIHSIEFSKPGIEPADIIHDALQAAGLQSWKNCMAMKKRRQQEKASSTSNS